MNRIIIRNRDVKFVKPKDFDNAAFKRGEFDIAICSPEDVLKTLRFLSERGYVWGGSKTSLLKDSHMKEQLLQIIWNEPIYITIDRDAPNGILRASAYMLYTNGAVEIDFEEDMNMNETKKVKAKDFDWNSDNNKIVITNDGKITTATLYSNGKKAGIGTAICHDSDKFDIYTGATLALLRLEKYKKETEMTDWERFVKDEVNMRVPKKHIQNFLSRAAKDSLRFVGPMEGWYLKWLKEDGDSILVGILSGNVGGRVLTQVLQNDNGTEVLYIPGMK